MMLWQRMAEPFVLLVPTAVPDGSGGNVVTWADGDTFSAAVVRDETHTATEAEAATVAATYTVTVASEVAATVALGFHTVFRRVRDGVVFRITSHGCDKVTPEVASFRFEQLEAERWVLPNDNL